jgi:hypothetical protein
VSVLAPLVLAVASFAPLPASPDIDPNLYVNSLGTMVTYDDLVNERDYDDGWAPDAWKPFEAALAPHGTWADTRELGRVWFPSPAETGPTFVPYSAHGRWALTDAGWTWLSDRPWGWAVFHYGRWAVLPGRGWCWVPGTRWSPAWVAWRTNRNYVAWAPLPPRGIGLGRPLGPRSPWSMTGAATLGARDAALVPRRVLPSLFVHTTTVTNPRDLRVGADTLRFNAGPTLRRRAREVPRLAAIAPDAAPRDAIRPAPSARQDARPWVQQGFTQQTPLCRWRPDASDTGPCFVVSAAPEHERVRR